MLDIFVEKSRRRHGDKYDYSRVEYRHSQSNVDVVCQQHGIFSCKPAEHVRGRGCPTCGRAKANAALVLSQDEVLRRFRATHGDEYDYSLVAYVGQKSRVIITHRACATTFEVLPGNHMNGARCLRCFGSPKKSHADFAREADAKHGGAYDYSKTSLGSNLRQEIVIVHRACGHVFTMSATKHLNRGQGCPRCFGTPKKTIEQFVTQARLVHGDRFDYSRVEYNGAHVKVKLTCRACLSSFEQDPSNHLQGAGCLQCFQDVRVSKMETAWLDSLSIPVEHRNVFVTIDDRWFNADALVDDIVFEFYGTYWHGDPRIYASSKLNTRNGRTMGELYEATLERERLLQMAGYSVKFLWEEDLKRFGEAVRFSPCHPHEEVR